MIQAKSMATRMVAIGAVAALLFGLGASPATAKPEQPKGAPSSTIQHTPHAIPPGGDVGTQAQYTQFTSLYYWGAQANVAVVSGQVSLGVFCTGWGWYQTNYMYPAPDGTVGYWTAWVDCGRFIPATNYRYLTQG